MISEIGDRPINGINEMMPDGTGGIYFGTVDLERIKKGEPVRPASLYRLILSGQTHLVADALGFANGIMLSADWLALHLIEDHNVNEGVVDPYDLERLRTRGRCELPRQKMQ